MIGEVGVASTEMSPHPVPGDEGAGTSKRRRHVRPGWAWLHEDLVRLLASRLLAGDLLDYVRFRAVCRGWRSGTDSPRGQGVMDPRFHPRRWMMLPEGHGLYPGHADLGGYARFLNLDTGRMVRARIPLLRDHCAIDSIDGLLLLLRDLYNDSAVRLLHPFTGDVTDLPPLGSLLPQLADTPLLSCPAPYRLKALTNRASAAASFGTGGGGARAITVVLSLYQVHRVAFATSLDEQWTLASWPLPSCNTPFPLRGKLYIVHTPIPSSCGERVHQVLQIDPPVQDGAANSGFSLKPPKLIATIPASNLLLPMCLVESDSNILLIGHKDSSMSRILVYKLDLVQQRFLPIKSIGGNSLIVGERSMSVSSRVLPTIEGDSVIHLRSSSIQPPYVAQYHLSSDTVSPAIDDCSLYGLAQGPSNLIRYLFSCCARSLWDRGLVFRRKPQPWFQTR